MSNSNTFDFKDDKGPVSAHRHINPDGTLGGWVANTVCVENTAFIGANARVFGNARVYDDAQVNQNMYINFSSTTRDLSKRENIRENIKAQTGLIASDKYVYCFKQVNKDMSSFHDNKFFYVKGKRCVASKVDESNVSCASGLHFSNATYWEDHCDKESLYLMCKVYLKDIITVQEGKIRARACIVMNVYQPI